ncbi:MAG: hypothetical protein QG619_2377 [Pseudomonadota bacterium]|nr:hypothetical protein [Pseudomonadota bacterium]
MTDILATIQRGLKAPKDKENKFGGYNYRNAESILRAFKEVQPEGVSLTMSDAITLIGDRLFLTATVKLHHGGNIIAEAQGAAMHALAKKGMDDAQITGACSSYARKYALCGLFAIDDSTDDPDSKDNSRATDNAAEEDAKAAAKAQEAIGTASTVQELEAAWLTIPVHLRKDKRLLKAATDRKAEITNEKEAA